MTIQTDINNFRTDNSINSNQLIDPVALRFYNRCRDYLIDCIIMQKEDYFYDEMKTNTVSWQREYAFPKRWDLSQTSVPLPWLLKLKWISIKSKTSDTDYTKLWPKTLEWLPEDLLSYDNSFEKFYVVSDTSYFIYPTPTENISAGIIIYGIFYPVEVIGTNEELNFIKKYQDCIFLWVMEKYFRSIYKLNESNQYKALFEQECKRVAWILSWRDQSPVPRFQWYLNQYE